MEDNKELDVRSEEEKDIQETNNDTNTETNEEPAVSVETEEVVESPVSTEETTEDNTSIQTPEETTDVSANWIAGTPDITNEAKEAIEEIEADTVQGEYNGTQNLEEMKNYFHPINYVKTSSSTIDEQVETIRKSFSSKWTANKVFNIASIVVMLVCFVAVLLVAFLIDDESLAWLTWTVIGIALVLIIACFIVGGVLNKKTNKYAEQYLDQYEDTINGYTLSGLNLEDTLICTQGQLDDQLVIQSHCFTNISSISSRGVVLAKRNGHEYSSGEAAVIVPTITIDDANKTPTDYIGLDGEPYFFDESEPLTDTSTIELNGADMTMIDTELAGESEGKKAKKNNFSNNQPTGTNTGLYGRFYSYDAKVSHKEAIIIAIMGIKAHTYLPDYLTGFTPVKVPGLKHNIVIYAADISQSAKFFDEEGVRLLNNIPVNTVVYSHFLSINSYGMKCGMNLSDDIMELPLNRIEHLGSYDLLKDATEAVFAYFDYVESKKA